MRRTHETLSYEPVVLNITLSLQARSRYSSLATVLGSEIPRQVPAALKYMRMINVISLQPVHNLMFRASVSLRCARVIGLKAIHSEVSV